MGEVTQRMGETVDGRKNFKLKKRSSKIYRVIGKKSREGAANLGSSPGGRYPSYAIEQH